MRTKIDNIKQEIAKSVVGQEGMIESLLIGLFTGGHVLLEGVPGLAKTTTVKSISSALGLDFKRVQFTPDLLPSDIIGAQIYDLKSGDFKIKNGPIFTNILLADEINRAPAKVQSALLEVMQEKQVTIGDDSFKIDEPFLVLATQNPIEQEGAYSLPEAQLDRFMFKVVVGYNSKDEELEIARRISSEISYQIDKVLSKDDIVQISQEIKNIHIDKEVEEYIVDLIHATREENEYIYFGASPRATIDMFKASKAKAYMRGNSFVTPVDVAKVAKDVLRHRVIISYEAEADGITSDELIDKIIESVDIP